MYFYRARYVGVLLLVSVLLMSACTRHKQLSDWTFEVMNRQGKIISSENPFPKEITLEAQKMIRTLESQLSFYDSNSEISQINHNAAIRPVHISEVTWRLLNRGLTLSKMSEGVFDITYGPLVELWNRADTVTSTVSRLEVGATVDLVDYTQVAMYPQKKQVFLSQPGMALNIDLLLEGYIIDRLSLLFMEHDIEAGIISCDAFIRVWGKEKKRIPLSEIEKSYLMLQNETAYIIDGSNAVISTVKGYPVDHDVMKLVLITKDTVSAGVMGYIIFALGPEKGVALANVIPYTDVVWVMDTGSYYYSQGVRRRIKQNE